MAKNRDFAMYFDDIMDSIEKIENYIFNVNEKDFSASEQLKDAVARRVEIIGEASKNLPASIKNKHKEINWQKLRNMRNIFAHEYFGINYKKLWSTATKEAPELKPKIEKIMKELGINRLDIK